MLMHPVNKSVIYVCLPAQERRVRGKEQCHEIVHLHFFAVLNWAQLGPSLKGQYHEVFDPFSSNKLYLGPI